jgi:hypothetical protein
MLKYPQCLLSVYLQSHAVCCWCSKLASQRTLACMHTHATLYRNYTLITYYMLYYTRVEEQRCASEAWHTVQSLRTELAAAVNERDQSAAALTKVTDKKVQFSLLQLILQLFALVAQ